MTLTVVAAGLAGGIIWNLLTWLFGIPKLAASVAPDSAETIKAAITAVTHTQPHDSDIARVRARLAAGGWPLAAPDRSA